jgi:hypothetical protein
MLAMEGDIAPATTLSAWRLQQAALLVKLDVFDAKSRDVG